MQIALRMVVGLALALGFQAAHAKSVDDGLMWWLHAEVEISPEGRITALEWRDGGDVERKVAADVEPRIRAWRFEPGMINGVAHTTTTYLTVQLLGEVQGESVAIRIGHASTGARSAQQAPPVYPMTAARAGADAVVIADLAVDEAGNVTVESIDYRGNRAAFRTQFVEATKAAIAKWSFTPERVGGRALATRFRVPVSFCVTRMDCDRKYLAPRNGDRADPRAAPGTAVALESAVRLIDAVDGRVL